MTAAGNLELTAGSFGARLGRGFWSLCDQGVVSLGNFAMQIVLARSLSHSDYGVFALTFGVLLVLFMCHGGFVAYPLSLEGASASCTVLRKMAFGSLVLTAILAIPFSPIAFVATSVVLHRGPLFWAVLLAIVMSQMQETTRRALMAHLRHRDAVWGDSLSYLGQAAILFLLVRRGGITLEEVFVTMGLTSAAAALLQSFQLGWSFMGARSIAALALRYWTVGRWAVLTSLNEAGIRQIFPWVLALVSNPAEAAPFQTVVNLVGVSHPVLFGINNLIVPAAAAADKRGGILVAWKEALRFGAIGASIILPFFLALLIWPHQILAFAYGAGSSYAAFTAGLRLAVLSYLFFYCTVVLAAFLYSLGRSRLVFNACLLGTALAIVPALALTVEYGPAGAISGMLLIAASRFAINAALAAKMFRAEKNCESPAGDSSLKAAPSLIREWE